MQDEEKTQTPPPTDIRKPLDNKMIFFQASSTPNICDVGKTSTILEADAQKQLAVESNCIRRLVKDTEVSQSSNKVPQLQLSSGITFCAVHMC